MEPSELVVVHALRTPQSSHGGLPRLLLPAGGRLGVPQVGLQRGALLRDSLFQRPQLLEILLLTLQRFHRRLSRVLLTPRRRLRRPERSLQLRAFTPRRNLRLAKRTLRGGPRVRLGLEQVRELPFAILSLGAQSRGFLPEPRVRRSLRGLRLARRALVPRHVSLAPRSLRARRVGGGDGRGELPLLGRDFSSRVVSRLLGLVREPSEFSRVHPRSIGGLRPGGGLHLAKPSLGVLGGGVRRGSLRRPLAFLFFRLDTQRVDVSRELRLARLTSFPFDARGVRGGFGGGLFTGVLGGLQRSLGGGVGVPHGRLKGADLSLGGVARLLRRSQPRSQFLLDRVRP